MFTLFDQEWITQIHEKNLIRETAKAARLEGVRETTLTSLQNLMDSLNITSDQAMSALKVPEFEQPEYRRLLELRQ